MPSNVLIWACLTHVQFIFCVSEQSLVQLIITLADYLQSKHVSHVWLSCFGLIPFEKYSLLNAHIGLEYPKDYIMLSFSLSPMQRGAGRRIQSQLYCSGRRHRVHGERRRPRHGHHGHYQAARRLPRQLFGRGRRRHQLTGQGGFQDHHWGPKGDRFFLLVDLIYFISVD